MIRASSQNKMKPRHAAFAGWFLMLPPVAKCWRGNAQQCPNINCLSCESDPQAPIWKWNRVPDTQEFEYKTDCERAISDECHPQVEEDGKSYLEGNLCGADCIAGDDPRLKPN